MTLKADWSYPTRVRFGAGRIAEIAEVCVAAGITKPLLITDCGLVSQSITHRTLELTEAAGFGAALFAEVDANPTETNAEASVAAYRADGYDGVIAFGGGSGLDLAKTVVFIAGQNRPIWDFEDVDDWWMRADADAIHPWLLF